MKNECLAYAAPFGWKIAEIEDTNECNEHTDSDRGEFDRDYKCHCYGRNHSE